MLTTNLLALAAYALTVGIPGAALATRFRLPHRAYYPPLAIALGSALITGELFLYFVIGRGTFSPWLFVIAAVQALAAIVWLVATKRQAFQSRVIVPKLRWTTIAVGLVIAAVLGSSLILAYVKPVAAFDAVTFWSLRSKILLHDGRVDFNPESFTYLAATSHRNYPWHVSLSEYWLRRLGASGGALNLIPWANAAALVWMMAAFLLRRLKPLFALGLVALFVSMPFVFYHSFNSYADLTLALYVAAAFICLAEWLRTGRRSLLILSALLIGWSFFVKNEGIFHILSWAGGVIVAYLSARKKPATADAWTVAALLGPIAPWIIAKVYLGLGLRNTPAAPGWYPQAFEYIGQAFALVNNWNVWWYLFVGLLIIRWPALRRRSDWPLWAIFGLSVMITAVLYLVTENYRWALDHTALSRTMLPLMPLSVMLAGLLLQERHQQ